MSNDAPSPINATHVVLGGVILVAAGMLLAIFNAPGLSLSSTPPGATKSSRNARAPHTHAGGEASSPTAPAEPPPAVAYGAEALRDPMMSLLPAPKSAEAAAPAASGAGATTAGAAASAEPVAPSVQGLVWGGGHPQALIDGKLYQVGQMVGLAKILAITHDGVTVSVRDMHHLWQPVRPLQVSATPEGGQP